MDDAFGIPLNAMIPPGVGRLIVAGRCISGTHEAQSSYRVMPICMATGQAAGISAPIASHEHQSIRAIPVEDIQKELRRQGANLGD